MSGRSPLTIYRSLSHFVASHFDLEEGDKEGRCIFCGHHTEKGFPIKLSDNFTAWSSLQAGEAICPACNYMLRHQEFRRRSWLVTAKAVEFKKAREMLQYILEPPDPPFAIYVTLQGKKHGWIQLNQVGVNYSSSRYFVGFEENVILVSRDLAKAIYSRAKKLREMKVSKAELLAALPKPKTVMKTGRGVWGELQTLKSQGEDVYELVVRLL